MNHISFIYLHYGRWKVARTWRIVKKVLIVPTGQFWRLERTFGPLTIQNYRNKFYFVWSCFRAWFGPSLPYNWKILILLAYPFPPSLENHYDILMFRTTTSIRRMRLSKFITVLIVLFYLKSFVFNLLNSLILFKRDFSIV